MFCGSFSELIPKQSKRIQYKPSIELNNPFQLQKEEK